MKAVLVLTPFDHLKSVGFRTGHVKRLYGYYMPLGLAYLAAALEDAGHQVAAMDPGPRGMAQNELVDWILAQNPDVVGISAMMSHVAPIAYRLAEAVKKQRPQLPVVLGGSHCSVFPEKVLPECPAVDVVVIGEAEDRIVPLMDALHRKSPLEAIPGLIYRGPDGAFRNTGAPRVQMDLNRFSPPARHLFDHSFYRPFPDQIRKTPVATMMSSRGCAWRKCKFCFEGGRYMPHYRRRSPQNVMAEIEQVVRQGFRGVAFWDDNFCVGEAWIERFCSLLRERKLGITWSCYGRVDTITEKMIRDIKSAGCFSIYFGFESGSQEILDMTNKGTTLDQARAAVAACRRAGIEVRGSFIMGMPGDNPEVARQTVRFARELDLDSVKFMLYMPLEGTALYEKAMAEGALMPHGALGSMAMAPYVPFGYESAAQLEQLAMEANRSYVLRPRYIWRKILSVRHWADIRKYLDGLLLMMSLDRK